MKGNEDLARSIIPVSSDLSGFSRGTVPVHTGLMGRLRLICCTKGTRRVIVLWASINLRSRRYVHSCWERYHSAKQDD